MGGWVIEGRTARLSPQIGVEVWVGGWVIEGRTASRGTVCKGADCVILFLVFVWCVCE